MSLYNNLLKYAFLRFNVKFYPTSAKMEFYKKFNNQEHNAKPPKPIMYLSFSQRMSSFEGGPVNKGIVKSQNSLRIPMIFPRMNPKIGRTEPFKIATKSPGIMRYFSLPKKELILIFVFLGLSVDSIWSFYVPQTLVNDS